MYASRHWSPEPPADCQYTWLDSGDCPEDAPEGVHVHECTLPELHGGDCECACGAAYFPPVPPGLGLRRWSA